MVVYPSSDVWRQRKQSVDRGISEKRRSQLTEDCIDRERYILRSGDAETIDFAVKGYGLGRLFLVNRDQWGSN